MCGITKFVNILSLKESWPILNNFDWYVIWIRRCFLLCEGRRLILNCVYVLKSEIELVLEMQVKCFHPL
jgi:hypothetical protein